MNNKGLIIAGLVIFLAVVTLPIWYSLAFAEEVRMPELELPTNATQCIEEASWMRANHMDLLNEWRDAVVRDGEYEYTSVSEGMTGQTCSMSLTGTCLSCHTSRDTFCNRCHEYAGVEPTCWDCHIETGGN